MSGEERSDSVEIAKRGTIIALLCRIASLRELLLESPPRSMVRWEVYSESCITFPG